MATWDNLNEAFGYIQHYLGEKNSRQRFTLSAIELALVSNFKGGNASVVEPIESLTTKLKIYSAELANLNEHIADSTLRLISNRLADLQRQAQGFLLLTIDTATKIKGFGPANASALLAAYFPETLPVIDRLVLLGAEIRHDRDSRGQVIDIETHYPTLIAKCHLALMSAPRLSLRELDKKWFELGRARSKQLSELRRRAP